MITNLKRVLYAAVISFVLLSILLLLADFNLPAITHIDPVWGAAMLGAHGLMVASRGLHMRTLSTQAIPQPSLSWIGLAARHQALFSILPSGTGDLGFPLFAKRYLSIDSDEGLRIIFMIRLRDLAALGTISIAGFLLLVDEHVLAFVSVVLGVFLIWFVEDVTSFFVSSLSRRFRTGRIRSWLEGFTAISSHSLKRRANCSLWVVVSWSASLAAVAAVFLALNQPLSFGETLVFVALTNAAGAIAISIAGFGVAEAGATGALAISGRSLETAASTALVVRPTLLLSVLVCCAAIVTWENIAGRSLGTDIQ